jgi:hypothetical protein
MAMLDQHHQWALRDRPPAVFLSRQIVEANTVARPDPETTMLDRDVKQLLMELCRDHDICSCDRLPPPVTLPDKDFDPDRVRDGGGLPDRSMVLNPARAVAQRTSFTSLK